MWVVPDVSIWGRSAIAALTFVTIESVQGATRIMSSTETIGEASQTIFYADLIDHRGNRLPAQLIEPKAHIQVKSPDIVFLVGREFSSGFRVARPAGAATPALADIIIYDLS